MDYPIRTPHQLEALLKAFRKKAQWSQTTLAGRLGVTQQALSELEREPQNASVGRLMQLLSALGVEIVLREDRIAPGKAPGEW